MLFVWSIVQNNLPDVKCYYFVIAVCAISGRGHILHFDALGRFNDENYFRTPALIANTNCSCVMTFDYLLRGVFVRILLACLFFWYFIYLITFSINHLCVCKVFLKNILGFIFKPCIFSIIIN